MFQQSGKLSSESIVNTYHRFGRFGPAYQVTGISRKYVNNNEDMSTLFEAIIPLKSLPWLPKSVRDIRAFKIEQWSDFTKIAKN